MKHLFIILCCDYIDSEQSSGQIICTKSVHTPYVVNGCCLREELNSELLLHIYTVIAPMYDPFQEYSVKRGLIVCLSNRMFGNTSNFDASNSVHGVYY